MTANPEAESLVRQAVAEVLGIDAGILADDAGLGTLDSWDSLAHVQVLYAVEMLLGRELQDDEFDSCTDLGAIVRLVGLATPGPDERDFH